MLGLGPATVRLVAKVSGPIITKRSRKVLNLYILCYKEDEYIYYTVVYKKLDHAAKVVGTSNLYSK
jgi:hypothetical protein